MYPCDVGGRFFGAGERIAESSGKGYDGSLRGAWYLAYPLSAISPASRPLRVGMLFFAAVNAVALIATIIVVPDLPVEREAVLWFAVECAEGGKNMALHLRRDVFKRFCVRWCTVIFRNIWRR